MLKKQPEQITYTHEDLFLARYERLRAWAAQLTDHDPQLAEDLVHDVFVKFALTQPDLQRIENLDGYLYTALRNTYRSQIRRAGRVTTRQLSILDYDSAELGLRAVEPRRALDVQEELRLICHYACSRKESAKAASVLILRYFLGYFPSEIATILRAERQSVAESLRVARAEARLFARDPSRLRFTAQSPAPNLKRVDILLTTEGLLRALWQQIFDSNTGPCVSRKDLERKYQGSGNTQIEREALAHWVSCPRCLDQINEILGLSSLTDRNPMDSSGPDPGGSDPGSRGGMGESDSSRGGRKESGSADRTGEALKRFRRRVQLVYEHSPSELRIVINGQPAGSQEIGAELNKQTLSLSETEPINFIEIYSEQGVRMAYMVVEEPPKGEFVQLESLGLSEDRRLDLSLSFKGLRPELEVLYLNPLSKPKSVDLPAKGPAPAIGFSEQEEFSREKGTAPQGESADWGELWRLLTRLGGLIAKPRTVVLIGVISVAIYLLVGRPGPPTVASVLRQAAAAEASKEELISRSPNQVFHRSVEIEVSQSGGKPFSRRRVEIWRNARKQLLARRLYDENGLLLVGEWRASGEASKFYRRRGGDGLPAPAGAESAIPDWSALRAKRMPEVDELWRLDLSTKDFLGFINASSSKLPMNGPASETLEEGPQVYEIRYGNLSQGLVSATLTLDRGDLHPVEQQFHFRYGNEDRIVRFVEKSSESRPLSVDTEKVFEVDAELTIAAADDPATTKSDFSESVQSLPAPPVSASPVATAALEMKALSLLHQTGADLGEEVSLTRSAEGRLKIEAVVATAQRRTEILDALAPIATQPAVLIRIETSAEASRRKASAAQAAPARGVEEYTAAGATILAEPMLRAYAERKIASGISPASADEASRAVEAEIRQVATQMVKRSQRALQRAYALKRVSTGFTPDEIRALDEGGRAEWNALIRDHARGFSVESNEMIAQLRRLIDTADAPQEASVGDAIKSDADLLAAIDRLFQLGTSVDRAIRSAFAVRAQEAPRSDVKMIELWQSLRVAEKLSSEIQKRSAVNN